jgi:hypothetical protein
MDERIQARLLDSLLGKPLVSNAFRGTLVEAIVAEALEPDWRWRADGWGLYDFEGPKGVGLEVKQSAARQDWHDEGSKASTCQFDIAERLGHYTDDDGRWVDAPGRPAAIYVFAHHPVFDTAIADHRDPEQWEFYVVPASKLPPQKTIRVSGVRALADPVSFGGLLDAVNHCHSELSD